MARKALSIKTLFRLRTIQEIRIAPDGSAAAAVVTEPNEAKQRVDSSLWIWRAEDDSFEPLTNGPKDRMPRWIDASTIVFAGAGRGADEDARDPLAPTRLYTLSLRGGEPRLRAELPGIATAMETSPKGGRLALAFSPHPKAKAAQREAWRHAPKPVEVRNRLYKLDGRGYLPEALAGVWTLSTTSAESWPKPKPVLESDTHAVGMIAWMPDGKSIVAAQRDADADDSGMRAVLVPASGGAARALAVPHGPIAAIAPSPGGEWIAFAGNGDPLRGAYKPRPLCVVSSDPDREGARVVAETDGAFGVTLTLSDIAPCFVGGMRWIEPDRLATLHSLHGRTELVEVRMDTGQVDVVAGQAGCVWAFDAAGGAMLFAHGDPLQPGELFRAGRVQPLSKLNAKQAPAFRVQPRRAFVDTEPGARVDTWLWATDKQLAAKKAASLPLVLSIHGGPMAQAGDAPFHEHAWLAEQGFPVLASNPRGSLGYGEDHGVAIHGAWGDRDAHDLMAIVEAVLARHPQFDPRRVHCIGGSYGGYMVLHLLGAHPEAFAGGVAQRSVSDFLSFAGTSDIHNAITRSAIGIASVHDDPVRAWESSPIRRVRAIRAPLLLLHSDADHRCPLGQAEEAFHALAGSGRAIGRDVRMVVFRGESHELSRSGRPENRRARLEEILGWLKQCDEGARG